MPFAEGALDPALVRVFGEQRPGDVGALALVPVAVLDVDDLVIGIFGEHGFEAVHAHGHFGLNLSAGDDDDIRRLAPLLLQALDEIGRGELARFPTVIFDRRLVVGRRLGDRRPDEIDHRNAGGLGPAQPRDHGAGVGGEKGDQVGLLSNRLVEMLGLQNGIIGILQISRTSPASVIRSPRTRRRTTISTSGSTPIFRALFVCRGMRSLSCARKGVILNMASGLGLVGMTKQAAYSSAKGAIIGLTRQMAVNTDRMGCASTPLRPD